MATTTPDLAGSLVKALAESRPISMAERAERDDMVALVLNPGSSSSVGNQRFGPGDMILVDEDHAVRLTTPRRGQSVPAARYLDEPEPDMRGNFPQPHGAGRYHPESKHAKREKDSEGKPKAGPGEKVIDGEVFDVGVPSHEDRVAASIEHGTALDLGTGAAAVQQQSSSSSGTGSSSSSPGGGQRSSGQGGSSSSSGGQQAKDKPKDKPKNPGGNSGGQQGGSPGGTAASQQGGSTPSTGQTGDTGNTVGDGGKSGG